MKRNKVAITALLLAAMMGLSACGSDKGTTSGDSGNVTAADGPFTKYEEPIKLTVIRSDNKRSYMPGDSLEDNVWTRHIKEQLNIEFDYLWICDQSEFDSKMNLAIATDDLADVMSVPYDAYYQMAKAGKLADLTEAYDKYASDDIKKFLSDSESMAIKACTVNEKLYGIGSAPDLGLGNILWYRNDWAKNVGITEKPQTMDDVVDMAYKFAQEDPNKDGSATVGLGLTSDLWDGGIAIEGFFAGYGSYPIIWVEENGEMVYGGVQDSAKEVLGKLQKMYADGVIDQDFINVGAWEEGPDNIVKGKIGMAFGPSWFCDWQTGNLMASVGYDATWTGMLIPSTAAGETGKASVKAKQGNILCGVASSKHPEALIKMANLQAKELATNVTNAKLQSETDPDGNVVNNYFHINDLLGQIASNVNKNYDISVKVTEAFEAKDPSGLNAEEKGYYDRSMAYINQEDPTGYCSYGTFIGPDSGMQLAAKMSKEQLYQMDGYYGPNTDTMNDKWGNITSKQKEIYTRIIMGNDLNTEWDSWITFFEQQGGKDITEEVNAWKAEQ